MNKKRVKLIAKLIGYKHDDHWAKQVVSTIERTRVVKNKRKLKIGGKVPETLTIINRYLPGSYESLKNKLRKAKRAWLTK